MKPDVDQRAHSLALLDERSDQWADYNAALMWIPGENLPYWHGLTNEQRGELQRLNTTAKHWNTLLIQLQEARKRIDKAVHWELGRMHGNPRAFGRVVLEWLDAQIAEVLPEVVAAVEAFRQAEKAIHENK